VSNKKIKADNWDGKSRPSNDKYRENFDDIFGKKQNDELNESYKQSKLNKKERIEKENEEYLKEIERKL
tara:strand:+ start:190 stop:396 length:207 start_codon:yes stop_codon:yes gene_type:complete